MINTGIHNVQIGTLWGFSYTLLALKNKNNNYNRNTIIISMYMYYTALTLYPTIFETLFLQLPPPPPSHPASPIDYFIHSILVFLI